MSSILDLIKNWYNRFFGQTSLARNAEPLPEITPEVSIAKTPGLSCPVCAHRIVVSIESLLSGQDLQCPSCGLELSVDEDKSGGALEALSKLQNGLNQASKIKSENGV